MREIKFRAYDKDVGKLLDVLEIDFDFKTVVLEIDEFNTTKNGFHRIILEQYTGLKDKNGKEICVGDIVKRRATEYVVETDGRTAIGLVRKNVFYNFTSYDESIYEVIGNIHEGVKE